MVASDDLWLPRYSEYERDEGIADGIRWVSERLGISNGLCGLRF